MSISSSMLLKHLCFISGWFFLVVLQVSMILIKYRYFGYFSCCIFQVELLKSYDVLKHRWFFSNVYQSLIFTMLWLSISIPNIFNILSTFCILFQDYLLFLIIGFIMLTYFSLYIWLSKMIIAVCRYLIMCILLPICVCCGDMNHYMLLYRYIVCEWYYFTCLETTS